MKSRRVAPRRLLLEELEGRLVPSTTTSTNWSGYAVTAPAATVTAVSGSWVVPTFTQSSASGYAASWVGIDGYSSNTVEQTGTEADYSNGHASYYAWYEMYPAGMVTIPLTVSAGNTISASVTYAANAFTLSLTDVTTGKSYSKTLGGAGDQRSSAEWIVEAPWSGGVLPLDGFGTETFSGDKATINNTSGPIDGAFGSGTQVEQINMVNQRGAQLDSTGAVSDSSTGSTFSVTFTGSSSSGSGGGHHQRGGGNGFGWGWGWGWFSNMQSAPSATQLASLASALSGDTSRLLAPAASTVATQAAAIRTSSLASPSVSSAGLAALAGAGGNAEALGAGSAVQAAMPAVPPEGNQPGPPADGSKPDVKPDAAPMPPAAANEPAAALACDACFSDGHWSPAAVSDGASTARDRGDEDGTDLPSLGGVLFTLSLGGSWGIARARAEEQRRRQALC